MAVSVSSYICERVLYISPAGRIDSKNADETEKRIAEIRKDNLADGLAIDAKDLEYISSAGLRILLRLRKEISELKIINVSSEVYEILEMTGFTEMMKVEKAYRRLSVEGCEIIGRGSNGEVYRLDPDTIIKVYFNPDSLPDIQRERELARKAFVLGIPTAIPYDVVKVGDTYGSVFELLNAISFTGILTREPGRLDEIVGMYVELLKKIHSTEVSAGDMPDMKKTVLGWVDDIRECLSAEKWEKLRGMVGLVPDCRNMIHGDYHTKNIMVQNGEALLIDMDTLCYGYPVFEFASVYNAYLGFYVGNPPVEGLSFIGLPYDMGVEIWNKTIRLYFGTDDEKKLAEITDKSAVIGLVRVLRRTRRRCDMSDPEIIKYCSFLVGQIEEIIGRIDTLEF